MSIPLNETDKKIRDKRYISTKNGVTVFFVLSYFHLYQVNLTFLCICLNFVTIFFILKSRVNKTFHYVKGLHNIVWLHIFSLHINFFSNIGVTIVFVYQNEPCEQNSLPKSQIN